jgi:hypothetical protein
MVTTPPAPPLPVPPAAILGAVLEELDDLRWRLRNEPIPSRAEVLARVQAIIDIARTLGGAEADRSPSGADRQVAKRVAHRFAAAFFTTGGPPTVDLTNADSSALSATELRRLLEPTYGAIARLGFLPVAGSANTATFEALAASGNIITGRVVIHAVVTDERVTSWAEVIVEDEAIPF